MGGASRLAVRPTARGWQALIFGLLILLVARLIGTTQFHQLAYALLALLLAALFIGWSSSRGLRYSRGLPAGTRITAGSRARIRLLLSNRSRLGLSDVSVTDHLPEQRDFEAPPLSGNGNAAIQAPLHFAKRGVYELGPAEVAVGDPFGLLRFLRRFGEKTEVVVYPEVHELRDFPIRGGNVEVGAQGSRGRRGDEFAGLREYRRGDDRRHIHWKSVARTGELYVKEFAVEAPRRYSVALDLRREGLRAPEAEVEDAVSVAASVLNRLARERLPFRLLCANGAGETTPFGVDEDSYWGAMRLLATARVDGARRLAQTALAEGDALGEGIVMISRTRNEELPAAVRKLRGAGLSVVVVAIATHSYRTPPGTGGAAQGRETEFLRSVDRLETAGATVRVVGHPSGAAGLSGMQHRQAEVP